MFTYKKALYKIFVLSPKICKAGPAFRSNCMCLDSCVLRFLPLFFFSYISTLWDNQRCSCTVEHCSCTIHRTHNHFIQKKIFKMGLMAQFTHLKIILL